MANSVTALHDNAVEPGPCTPNSLIPMELEYYGMRPVDDVLEASVHKPHVVSRACCVDAQPSGIPKVEGAVQSAVLWYGVGRNHRDWNGLPDGQLEHLGAGGGGGC
jgi:hypothetical protein